jgi:hypothetical protein
MNQPGSPSWSTCQFQVNSPFDRPVVDGGEALLSTWSPMHEASQILSTVGCHRRCAVSDLRPLVAFDLAVTKVSYPTFTQSVSDFRVTRTSMPNCRVGKPTSLTSEGGGDAPVRRSRGKASDQSRFWERLRFQERIVEQWR